MAPSPAERALGIVDRALGAEIDREVATDLGRLAALVLGDGLDRMTLIALLCGNDAIGLGAPWLRATSVSRLDLLLRCVRRAVPDADEAGIVLGAPRERSRLLDGLARRSGVQLAEDLLDRAPPWWFTETLAEASHHDRPGVGIRAVIRELGDRADRGAVRRLVRSGLREVDGTTELRVEWQTPPAIMVRAAWSVARGSWLEVAWQHPRVGLWVGDEPLGGCPAVTLQATLARRLSAALLVPIRPVDAPELGLGAGSPCSVRPVPRLTAPSLGVGG
jgi:hypothetical protein